MLESLIGSVLGGLFRLAPEVLKWLDRRDERAHELALFDKNLEADKMKAAAAQQLAETEAHKALGLADLQALIEATRAQGQPTGVKWVDGLNSLMRPVITFWWVIVLYTGALICQYLSLTGAGADVVAAVLKLWGPDEKAIVASIISFWFVDRSLRKGAGS